MARLKAQYLLTLAYLLSLGARHQYIPITTSLVGRHIGRSQQAASKHLLDLENDMFIERMMNQGTIYVRVTRSGFLEVERVSSALQKSLESASHISVSGTLVPGVGEGAYYMGLEGYTRQFKSKIGYVPFPGTLNVKVTEGVHLQAMKRAKQAEGITVDGFSDGKRTYGWVRCIPARINDAVDCHLILLERTHHDDSVAELISSICVRKAASLQDGSRISFRVEV